MVSPLTQRVNWHGPVFLRGYVARILWVEKTCGCPAPMIIRFIACVEMISQRHSNTEFPYAVLVENGRMEKELETSSDGAGFRLYCKP